MRYTDLTNEELDALVEMARATANKIVSQCGFSIFMRGLERDVDIRKMLNTFEKQRKIDLTIPNSTIAVDRGISKGDSNAK